MMPTTQHAAAPRRRSVGVVAIAIAGLLGVEVAAVDDAGPGQVEGRVVIGEKLSPRRARFRVYPQYNPRQALPPLEEANEVENVVVYLEQVPTASATPGRFLVEQRQERFVPHVIPVMKGTEVEFANADPIFHNVFSLSKARTFDLGRYPRNTSRFVRFDEPGIVKVYCHIHADMSAVVLVLDNPFFVTPAPDGTYAIDGIPPGRYTVVAWHERARRTVREVEVRRGQPSRVDFMIPLEDPSGS